MASLYIIPEPFNAPIYPSPSSDTRSLLTDHNHDLVCNSSSHSVSFMVSHSRLMGNNPINDSGLRFNPQKTIACSRTVLAGAFLFFNDLIDFLRSLPCAYVAMQYVDLGVQLYFDDDASMAIVGERMQKKIIRISIRENPDVIETLTTAKIPFVEYSHEVHVNYTEENNVISELSFSK